MAEWTEFDLDGSEWRIPAERMKMKERHIVPLSTQAVALLRELHILSGTQCVPVNSYLAAANVREHS